LRKKAKLTSENVSTSKKDSDKSIHLSMFTANDSSIPTGLLNLNEKTSEKSESLGSVNSSSYNSAKMNLSNYHKNSKESLPLGLVKSTALSPPNQLTEIDENDESKKLINNEIQVKNVIILKYRIY
jgi:hypothetical protein